MHYVVLFYMALFLGMIFITRKVMLRHAAERAVVPDEKDNNWLHRAA